MKYSIFKSLPVQVATNQFFTGVLDSPSVSNSSSSDEIIVSGWILPKVANSGYVLRIEHDGGSLNLKPTNPRLDVARKLGVLPFFGDGVFNGFFCKIPFSKRIRIYIQIDSMELLWKDMEGALADADVLGKYFMFKSVVVRDDRVKCIKGVLDSPSLSSVFISDDIVVSGWIIPQVIDCAYRLRIDCDDVNYIILTPNKARPEVAKKMNVAPFPGDDVFKGFCCSVPFSRDLKIYVQIGSDEFLWKHFEAIYIESELQNELIDLLAYGRPPESSSVWIKANQSSKMSCVDNLFSMLKIVDQGNYQDYEVCASEKFFFERFANLISGVGFFDLLLKDFSTGVVAIPSPFSESKAYLQGSFFNELNFLVFRSDKEVFYVGQYLHTADFVYFPSRSIVLRLTGSHYNHAHVRYLISFLADNPCFLGAVECDVPVVKLGGVIVNGVSPYHFFYDCLPALFVSGAGGGLKNVNSIFSLNGSCYFPIEELSWFSEEVKNVKVGTAEFCDVSNADFSSVYILAGASYKLLATEQLEKMDRSVVDCAADYPLAISLRSAISSIDGKYPVFWIGISAQKRSWVNQEDVLKRTIRELHVRYPNMAVVFDGMTSSIFGGEGNSQFLVDHEIVDRVVKGLGSDLVAVSVVGLTSLEKIKVCCGVDFFIANYSTGSMYPSRFLKLPGVTHSSFGLFSVVKDIHIHYDTSLFPFESVVDIPDQNCSRIDFVSYSIDSDKFVDFVSEIVSNKLKK